MTPVCQIKQYIQRNGCLIVENSKEKILRMKGERKRKDEKEK